MRRVLVLVIVTLAGCGSSGAGRAVPYTRQAEGLPMASSVQAAGASFAVYDYATAGEQIQSAQGHLRQMQAGLAALHPTTREASADTAVRQGFDDDAAALDQLSAAATAQNPAMASKGIAAFTVAGGHLERAIVLLKRI